MNPKYIELLDEVKDLRSVLNSVYDEIRPYHRHYSSDSYLPPHIQDDIEQALGRKSVVDEPEKYQKIQLMLKVESDMVSYSIIRVQRSKGKGQRLFEYGIEPNPGKEVEALGIAMCSALSDAVNVIFFGVGHDD